MPNHMIGVKEEIELHKHQQCCVWVLHNLRELVLIAANFIPLNQIQDGFFIYLFFFPNLCAKWLHTALILLLSTIFSCQEWTWHWRILGSQWGYLPSFNYVFVKLYFAIATISFFQWFLIKQISAEIWIVAQHSLPCLKSKLKTQPYLLQSKNEQ